MHLLYPDAEGTVQLGGIPKTGGDIQWPICKTCSGSMQFIASFPLNLSGISEFKEASKRVHVFECQNCPGLCDEWDPDSGGNKVVFSESFEPLTVPESGVVTSKFSSFAKLTTFDISDEAVADDEKYEKAYWNANPAPYGLVGRNPVWIQGDDTPNCNCGNRMSLLFQIEELGDFNFGGGGNAYTFICRNCPEEGRFLFQC